MAKFLQLNVPIEHVDMILEALEQTIEEIIDAECDCDDCSNMLDVLQATVGQIHGVAPLETPKL